MSGSLETEVLNGTITKKDAKGMIDLLSQLQYLEKPSDVLSRTMQEGKQFGGFMGAITSLIGRVKLGTALWAGASTGAAMGGAKAAYNDVAKMIMAINAVPGGKEMVSDLLKSNKGRLTQAGQMMIYRTLREYIERTLMQGKSFIASPEGSIEEAPPAPDYTNQAGYP